MPCEETTRTALGVEKLESRSLPSAALPPPIQTAGVGTFVFIPPGVADKGRQGVPVLDDGRFVPPAFGGETPAKDVAQVWQRTELGGAFFPVEHNYHVTTGFFGR